MNLKNLTKNYFFDLILIFLIFGIDRISKIYVIYLSDKSLISEVFSSKFLNIQLIWNEGIAFGLFSFNRTDLYNLLTVIISIVILIIFIMIIKNNGFKRYSLVMILGGAIGNLYDRVFYRAVPDFIDLHLNNFHWFTFNLADIFISLGVIAYIFKDINLKKKNE